MNLRCASVGVLFLYGVGWIYSSVRGIVEGRKTMLSVSTKSWNKSIETLVFPAKPMRVHTPRVAWHIAR